MNRPKFLIEIVILCLVAVIAGACTGQEKPEGTLTVAELLDDPVQDTEVRIYGEVSGIGELACTCFPLASGGETVLVWYDTMVENNGTLRLAVSIEGINKGDKIIVAGERKGESGIHYAKGDFWATEIVVQDQHLRKRIKEIRIEYAVGAKAIPVLDKG